MSRERNALTAASWPLRVLAAPAFVAIWTGWVGLGTLTGFGLVQPLPGIWDGLRIDSRALLPVGVEASAALALRAWLDQATPSRARVFARQSAIGSLVLGAAGQVGYHLMVAAGVARAPWPVTAAVACLPVAVLGMGAALAHLLRADPGRDAEAMATATRTTLDAAGSGPAPSTGHSLATQKRPARTVSGVPLAARGGDGGRHDTATRVVLLAAADPELSNEELAVRLGCSARTVRRHLAVHRAQQSQRSASAPHNESGDRPAGELPQLHRRESA